MTKIEIDPMTVDQIRAGEGTIELPKLMSRPTSIPVAFR